MDYNIWVAVPTDKPEQEGALRGYCPECGLMQIEGETVCKRCGGLGVVKQAPESKQRIWSKGYTASTAGNPINFDRY